MKLGKIWVTMEGMTMKASKGVLGHLANIVSFFKFLFLKYGLSTR